MAVTPDGTRAYVANFGGNSVSVIDTASNAVAGSAIPVGGGPEEVAITPDGTRAYVPNYYGNSVSVIDTASNTVLGSPIPVGMRPIGIAVTPDGTRAYVTNFLGNTVSVIDTASDTVVGSPVPVGGTPFGVAVTPDGTRAYVTNRGDNTVSVIDTASTTVVATIAVGGLPYGVAVGVTPNGTRAYVANAAGRSVSVIDTGSNVVVETFAVNFGPRGVAMTPDGTRAYVTNDGDAVVSVIDTASNTVIDPPLTVGISPIGVAVTPDGTRAYVTNFLSDSVSVISIDRPGSVTGVSVSGTAAVGSLLAATPSGVSGFPAPTVTYAWASADSASGPFVAIPNATTAGYTPVAGDAGMWLRVTATAANSIGSGSASATLGPVTAAAGIASVGLSGTAVVGSTLTATTSGVSGFPTPSLAHTWASAASAAGPFTPVANAATVTYSPVTEDAGRWLRVTVTATNGSGSASLSSTAAGPVTAPPSIASVGVSGTVAVGSTLTATASAVSGFPAPSVSYTWSSAASATGPFTAIPDATAANYAPTVADAGRWLHVTATATNSAGSTTMTSRAVGPVPVMTLTRVAPATGVTTGGTRVTITGSNFAAGASVTIGSRAATKVTVGGPTSITATVPAGNRGLVTVTVTNPSGQSVSKARAFSYLTPQVPLRSLGLPSRLRNAGWTRLLAMPVPTNAGQKATVLVQLSASLVANRLPRTLTAVGTGIITTKGDVGLGRVMTRGGYVWVWLPGTAPTIVHVTLRAAARPGYTSYLATKTYTTSA